MRLERRKRRQNSSSNDETAKLLWPDGASLLIDLTKKFGNGIAHRFDENVQNLMK